LGFKIDRFHNIYFSGEGIVCKGNDCRTGCTAILEGQYYETTGKVGTDRENIHYLELSVWRQASLAPDAASLP
jgi:hypothetical protein